MLPVLEKAKVRAMGIVCMSNSRQLGVAWHLYSDDNEGRLVDNGVFDGGPDYPRPADRLG